MCMKNLVIGLGEVGGAVTEVLQCEGIDKDVHNIPQAEVIHVCFPYSESFIQTVQKYREHTQAQLVVIHSTVPVGTCTQIGADVVHSPIRGKHPKLAESIRTFVKFFGGSRAKDAAQIFSDKGVQAQITDRSENTEALKLWDTEIYREAILLNKKIHQYCVENGLDFDIVYTQANATYNEGYSKLGFPQFTKYVLKYMDGPIGGHCVDPNHILLNRKSVNEK